MKKLRFPVVPPRYYQLPFWKAFDSGNQFNIISWPRRAGKDLTTFSIVVNRAIQVPGNYYYYFPTGAWAQRALWDNICEWAGGKRLVDLLCPSEIVSKKNNTEYYIDLYNGSRIKLGGTDNLDFVGQGGAGYVLSEYSLHKDDVTGYLMPILDQSNAWLIANGTMRGKNNPLYQLWENNTNRDNWFTQWYTLEHTKTNYWINEEENICINPELIGVIDPENGRPYKNIQDYVDSGGISFIKAKQEFLNRADGEVAGGYYGYEMKSIRNRGDIRPIDPYEDLVYTIWDLGGVKQDSDKTCITFAQVNMVDKTAKVVDYYENTGHKRGHYFDIIESKNYNYGGHYFPHDAKRSNEWTGETTADTALSEHGVEVRFIPKTQNVLNDIEITRRGLALTSFNNTPEVEDVIQHISSYHEKETTGKPCHQNNCQECGGASHGADTIRYLRMAIHMGLIEPYLQRKPREDRLSWLRKPKDDDVIDEDYFVV
jgi:hypothetical protein